MTTFQKGQHIYFIGIGGISMSGLAEILADKGCIVSGTDIKESPVTKHLQNLGIHINFGHKAENITDDVDLVVYTAAIHPDNPEYQAAQAKHIPLMDRARLLGEIMAEYEDSIAVAGTHGKTTTTSMVSEILLAVRYREVTPAGNFVGGAMYFIKNGLGEKWKWLGGLFAIFAAITCFGTGNAVQTNAISGVLWGTFGVPTWITALILFLLIASVLLGGLRRIGSVAGKIVPFMAILYTLASLLIIILNIKEVPAMFLHVIEEAFTPTAAQGGFAGATAMMAVRFGMARGIFANEAGLGSGPIAHATATSTPIRQATIGMLDVFITTMIVCSMTGFAILVTGEWTAVGAQGASLTARAFETALPGVGSAIVAISLVMFAFTTILGWCVYGERSAIFLFGDRVLKPFRILYTIVVPIGALAQLDLVWILADTFNALMAFPNLIGVLLLSPVVFKSVRESTRP